MTHVDIAKKIAEKIDTHTQEEIDAMITIVSETADTDHGWLFRVVGNLYAQINPAVLGQK